MNCDIFAFGCCSVIPSCLILCDHMDCIMPGFPVLHYLLEISQTHVHSVSDATQPSNALSPSSPTALIFTNIRVFSNESALYIRWPKDWSCSFNINPFNEHSGLISLRTDWFDLAVQGLSRVFSNIIVQKHGFSGTQPSLWSNSHMCTGLVEKPWL